MSRGEGIKVGISHEKSSGSGGGRRCRRATPAARRRWRRPWAERTPSLLIRGSESDLFMREREIYRRTNGRPNGGWILTKLTNGLGRSQQQRAMCAKRRDAGRGEEGPAGTSCKLGVVGHDAAVAEELTAGVDPEGYWDGDHGGGGVMEAGIHFCESLGSVSPPRAQCSFGLFCLHGRTKIQNHRTNAYHHGHDQHDHA